MGRMRRIPARIRFAPRTGLRKSAVAPRRCMWRWYFYNRSSAVVAHASVSRGRRANPVLTYKTALRRFLRCTARCRIPMENGFFYAPHVVAYRWMVVLCDAPHVGAYRWRMAFCDAPHVGAYRWMAVFSMGDVDGWQEVFMQNYSCGDCFEVMAFRYFSYDLSFN